MDEKDKSKILLKMFITFFKIGLFTFGGGYAMIPLIEKEVVENKKWVEKDKFTDTVSLTQTIPGAVAINLSILVGYDIKGVLGAVISTIGVSLPSFIIILAIAFTLTKTAGLSVLQSAFEGIRPAIAALIVYAGISLSKSVKWSMVLVLLAAGAFVAIGVFNINPIYIIVIAFIIGSLYSIPQGRKNS
ncbi:chromate transporter [Petrotoga sp. 9T1HF07.CasAA.8.2]|jgi:chromate transporter|uniref:chromate transporter n=1 Tax=Petrotoga sp. 9T1HF07.CasAA.8.2 TaxID=1434329 RepID=UPI000CAAAB8D|nr:chromate transporter [Petrotoga sp. 9T1HF07.CasAA.8.2]PNR88630.1 chromate transporter [Petrotoga sp. 9T1HF07.CasAA.8.2]